MDPDPRVRTYDRKASKKSSLASTPAPPRNVKTYHHDRRDKGKKSRRGRDHGGWEELHGVTDESWLQLYHRLFVDDVGNVDDVDAAVGSGRVGHFGKKSRARSRGLFSRGRPVNSFLVDAAELMRRDGNAHLILPEEVWLRIFSHLTRISDLGSVSSCCQLFANLCEDNTLWKRFGALEWSNACDAPPPSPDAPSAASKGRLKSSSKANNKDPPPSLDVDAPGAWKRMYHRWFDHTWNSAMRCWMDSSTSIMDDGMVQTPVCKVLVLGSVNVGKSSFIHRFTQEEFLGHHMDHTNRHMSVPFVKIIPTLTGECKLAMMDYPASMPQIKSMNTSGFFKNARGAYLVFSITDRQSFLDIEPWCDMLRTLPSSSSKNDVQYVICGTKADCPRNARQVTRGEAQSLADRLNTTYHEVSNKDGCNVHTAWWALLRQLVHHSSLESFSTCPIPRHPPAWTSTQLIDQISEKSSAPSLVREAHSETSSLAIV